MPAAYLQLFSTDNKLSLKVDCYQFLLTIAFICNLGRKVKIEQMDL